VGIVVLFVHYRLREEDKFMVLIRMFGLHGEERDKKLEKAA
jgi:hypothetical protein